MCPPPAKSEVGTALYFPTIEFRSEAWLKRTLLYWDRVRRVVPSEVRPNDSENVQRILDTGAIVNTAPKPYRDAASDRFESVWTPSLYADVRLRITGEPRPDLVLHEDSIPIHPEKFARKLLQKLRAAGLAGSDSQWIPVDRELGHVYMLCLASVMSSRIHAPMLTDTRDLSLIGQRFAYAGKLVSDAIRDNPAPWLLTVGIPMPTPKEMATVSVKRLLKFRERYATERTSFRLASEECHQRLLAVRDPNELNDVVSHQREVIARALREYRGTVRGFFGSAFYRLCDLSGPALLVGTSAQIAEQHPRLAAILAAGGLGLGLRQWYKDHRAEEREMRRAEPWNYVHLVHKLAKRPLFSIAS